MILKCPLKVEDNWIYCAATGVPKLSGLRTPSIFLEIAEDPTECSFRDMYLLDVNHDINLN